MDPQQITAYIQAAGILIAFGKTTVEDVAAMFKAHPAMSETSLNAILFSVRSDAERRAALATADAGG